MDYQASNEVIIKDLYPLPQHKDLMDHLGGVKYLLCWIFAAGTGNVAWWKIAWLRLSFTLATVFMNGWPGDGAY